MKYQISWREAWVCSVVVERDAPPTKDEADAIMQEAQNDGEFDVDDVSTDDVEVKELS